MNYLNIIYLTIGISTGIILSYMYIKVRWLFNTIDYLEDNISQLEHRILDPEEMAKKIITMKMPLSSLPPEVIEQLRQEAEGSGKVESKRDSMNYVG